MDNVIEIVKLYKSYNVWGFQGGDYEKFRLQEYKKPVRTSHETYFISATRAEPVNAM
jgi:hypothetical protein